MNIPRIEYMYWAKNRPAATYNLAVSGVPDVVPEDYGAQPEDLGNGVRGPYGDPRLIEAIAARYSVDPAGVVPLPGTSMANFVAVAANIERGDTVLVELPTYECLPRAVEFFGGCVRTFDRREDARYAPDLQQVEVGLRAGARAVMVSDLHNPSGLRLSESDRQALVNLTLRYGAALIIDEVYLDAAYLAGRAPLHTAATLGPHITVTNSLTKVYGLGPVRAGWLIGSPQVAERARNACDYLMVNNASTSMNLGARALSNIARLEQRSRKIHAAAWPILHEWLERRPHLRCTGNDGAVFVLIRLPDGLNAAPFVDHLVRWHDTLVVPGSFFQLPGHIRLGFAVEPELLREGLSRFDAAVSELAGSAT